jgi:hypothetical protein
MSRRTKYGLALALIATTVAALWLSGAWRPMWASLATLADYVHVQYGVDIPVALALFGIGELAFCGSVAMMLKEAGQQVTWGSIRSFDLKKLNLGSPRMMGWLWVNRASWVVPWLIVIALSLGKVPWWATVAALLEVGSTLLLGVAISFGLRLPWWNSKTEGETT